MLAGPRRTYVLHLATRQVSSYSRVAQGVGSGHGRLDHSALEGDIWTHAGSLEWGTTGESETGDSSIGPHGREKAQRADQRTIAT